MTTAANIIRPVIKPQTAHTTLLAMRDGGILCRPCTEENARLIIQATRERDNSGWDAQAHFHFAEGEPLFCDHCNQPQYPDSYSEPALVAILQDVAPPDYWQGSPHPYATIPVDADSTPATLIADALRELNYRHDLINAPEDDDSWFDHARAALYELQETLPLDKWKHSMPDRSDNLTTVQAYIVWLDN